MTVDTIPLTLRDACCTWESCRRLGVASEDIFLDLRGDLVLVTYKVLALPIGHWVGTEEELAAAWKEAADLWNSGAFVEIAQGWMTDFFSRVDTLRLVAAVQWAQTL